MISESPTETVCVRHSVRAHAPSAPNRQLGRRLFSRTSFQESPRLRGLACDWKTWQGYLPPGGTDLPQKKTNPIPASLCKNCRINCLPLLHATNVYLGTGHRKYSGVESRSHEFRSEHTSCVEKTVPPIVPMLLAQRQTRQRSLEHRLQTIMPQPRPHPPLSLTTHVITVYYILPHAEIRDLGDITPVFFRRQLSNDQTRRIRYIYTSYMHMQPDYPHTRGSHKKYSSYTVHRKNILFILYFYTVDKGKTYCFTIIRSTSIKTINSTRHFFGPHQLAAVSPKTLDNKQVSLKSSIWFWNDSKVF